MRVSLNDQIYGTGIRVPSGSYYASCKFVDQFSKNRTHPNVHPIHPNISFARKIWADNDTKQQNGLIHLKQLWGDSNR